MILRKCKECLLFLILVVSTIQSEEQSGIHINEVKLWGDEQFIELKNHNLTAEYPLSANFSLLLIKNPEQISSKDDELEIYKILDLSNVSTISPNGLVSLDCAFTKDDIHGNSTIGVALYMLSEGEKLNETDMINPKKTSDSMVFTHTEERSSLLSYLLPDGIDHNVDLDKAINQSLAICTDVKGLHRLTVPSPGKPNLCGDEKEPTITTQIPTTTISVQTTTGTSTETTTIGNSSVSSSTVSTQTPTTTGNSSSESTPVSTVTVPVIVPSSQSQFVNSHIFINEITLMTKTEPKFIEVYGPRNHTLTNIVMHLKNGMTGEVLFNKPVEKTDAQGFVLYTFDKDFDVNTLAVVLYEVNETSSKVLDSVVISKDGRVSDAEMEKYRYSSEDEPVFIFNSSKVTFKNLEVSISRCYDGLHDLKNTRNFVIAYPSRGDINNCTTNQHKYIQLKLNDSNCEKFRKHPLWKEEIAAQIVKATGQICQCGISSYAFQVRSIHCSETVVFESVVRTLTKKRLDDYLNVYRQFVNTTKNILIGNQKYQIDNSCYDDCYTNHHLPKKEAAKGSIYTTVVVVIVCVVLFLAIVGFIIFYLKRKKNGLLQFNMVRLEEDNGLLMNDAKEVRFREESAIII